MTPSLGHTFPLGSVTGARQPQRRQTSCVHNKEVTERETLRDSRTDGRGERTQSSASTLSCALSAVPEEQVEEEIRDRNRADRRGRRRGISAWQQEDGRTTRPRPPVRHRHRHAAAGRQCRRLHRQNECRV